MATCEQSKVIETCVVCGECFSRSHNNRKRALREKRAPYCSPRCVGIAERLRRNGGQPLIYAFGLPVSINGKTASRQYYTIMGRKGNLFVHVLIWEQSHGPVPDGMVVHHINGDPTDNRLSNLSCMTLRNHRRVHAGWIWDYESDNLVGCYCGTCGDFIPAPAKTDRRLSSECRDCLHIRKRVDDRRYRQRKTAIRKRLKEGGGPC